MIRTIDLIEYVKTSEPESYLLVKDYANQEYINEIVARLRAYDKLISCPRPKSNEIDIRELVGFINSCIINSPDFARKHYHEIIARLKELNDLKEGRIK